MTSKTSALDSAFIEQQRRRLRALHAELLETARATAAEETDLQNRSLDDAQEYEDDAQKLAILETNASLARRAMDRVRTVERALQKIEDGTYGISDVSNERIPKSHLDAVPEAIQLPDEETPRDR
jgi:DnaK suppressor protein